MIYFQIAALVLFSVGFGFQMGVLMERRRLVESVRKTECRGIEEFARIVERSKPMPREYAELVRRKFWDMLM